MMGLDLVEKEALMICQTQKGLKGSQNLKPMVTLIVQSQVSRNVLRSLVIEGIKYSVSQWIEMNYYIFS